MRQSVFAVYSSARFTEELAEQWNRHEQGGIFMAKTRQTPHFCVQSDYLNKKEKHKSSCDARKTLKVLEFILFNFFLFYNLSRPAPTRKSKD